MSKTKILPFSINKTKLPNTSTLNICHHSATESDAPPCICEPIEIVQSWKYLGIEIDRHLRWDKHIEELTKRLRRYIYLFLNLRNFLNLPLLKEFYFALVQSVLEYGINVYGRANKTVIEKLNIIQRSILKILYRKNRRYSTIELHKNLSILNITKLFYKNIGIIIHKNKSKYIKSTEHSHSLRKKNLILPICTTNTGQKTIEFIGPKFYEKIPREVKEAKDLKTFKYKLKKWLSDTDLVNNLMF